MVYGRSRRRTNFRSVRGRRRFRPTAVRKRPSYWKARRARRSRKPDFINSQSHLVKLKYFTYIDSDFAAAPGYVNNLTRLNSLFDPQFAAGGGTPSGLSILQNIWNRYKVSAAKVTARFVNTGTKACRVGMWAQPGTVTPPSTSLTTMAKLTELQSASAILLPSTYGQRSSVTLSRFYRIKNVIGRDNYNDNESSAQTTSDPIQVAYLYVTSMGDSGLNAPGATSTTRCYLTVTYYAKMYNNCVAAVD